MPMQILILTQIDLNLLDFAFYVTSQLNLVF